MTKQRQRLVEVPFNKTDCGVDFYINTAYGGECPWVLTEHEVFKTDFFEIFFIKKANGYVLIDYRKINLKDGMVFIVKPHQQQEWHIDEAALEYELLFTSKSISEIAYAFSFAEPSHLMRFFKQQTGKTCREFQEDYKNGVYE